jgi:hypothetical protein
MIVNLLMTCYERPNTDGYSLVLAIPSGKFIYIQTITLVLQSNANCQYYSALIFRANSMPRRVSKIYIHRRKCAV